MNLGGKFLQSVRSGKALTITPFAPEKPEVTRQFEEIEKFHRKCQFLGLKWMSECMNISLSICMYGMYDVCMSDFFAFEAIEVTINLKHIIPSTPNNFRILAFDGNNHIWVLNEWVNGWMYIYVLICAYMCIYVHICMYYMIVCTSERMDECMYVGIFCIWRNFIENIICGLSINGWMYNW
mgnify:CR=1 FL=1